MNRMSRFISVSINLLIIVSLPGLSGTVQASPFINYQGVVESGGESITRTCYFAFAITDAADSIYYWTSDGTSSPVPDIAVDVVDGLFNVKLGEAGGMAPLTPNHLGDAESYLKIWFYDGVHGIQLLSPRQLLGSVAFSFVAETALQADHAADADQVDGHSYNNNWPTTQDNIRSALGNDFHAIGGIDDDQPDSDSEVPDNISINNGELYSPAGSNNVGIGTTSPETKLHVNGDLTVDDTILADDSNGLRFATNEGTVRMIVTDSGDIGIGTTSPDALLHVDGDLIVNDTIQADAYSGIKFASEDGTTHMVMLNSGWVGIGTNTPSSRLEVNGRIELNQTLRVNNSDGLVIEVDDLPRLYIRGDGNVGIGTSVPVNHRLAVLNNQSGSNGTTGFFKNTNSNGIAMHVQNNSSDCTLLITQDDDGNLINCDSNYGGWHRVFVVEGDGSTGINTGSPSRMLYVNGDAGGSSAWNSKSDRRLKKNIATIDNALEKVLKLRGVKYEWTDMENQPQGSQIGFISQEVMEVLPEVVDKPDEYYAIQYGPITALLAEAVKDQQAIIRNQQEQIDELRAMMNQLMGEISGASDASSIP